MALVVHRIARIGDRVDSVYVIYIPIRVVVNSVTCDLQRVIPHVIDQVGVVVVDARIDNDRDLLMRANGAAPGGWKLHQAGRVLLWIVRVIWCQRGVHGPIR